MTHPNIGAMRIHPDAIAFKQDFQPSGVSHAARAQEDSPELNRNNAPDLPKPGLDGNANANPAPSLPAPGPVAGSLFDSVTDKMVKFDINGLLLALHELAQRMNASGREMRHAKSDSAEEKMLTTAQKTRAASTSRLVASSILGTVTIIGGIAFAVGGMRYGRADVAKYKAESAANAAAKTADEAKVAADAATAANAPNAAEMRTAEANAKAAASLAKDAAREAATTSAGAKTGEAFLRGIDGGMRGSGGVVNGIGEKIASDKDAAGIELTAEATKFSSEEKEAIEFQKNLQKLMDMALKVMQEYNHSTAQINAGIFEKDSQVR